MLDASRQKVFIDKRELWMLLVVNPFRHLIRIKFEFRIKKQVRISHALEIGWRQGAQLTKDNTLAYKVFSMKHILYSKNSEIWINWKHEFN